MKTLIFTCLLAISTGLSAEWALFATNVDGNKYWIDRESLRKKENNVWVWARERYAKQLGGVAGSCLTHYKIDCKNFSIQILESTFYSDKNWKKILQSEKSQHQSSHIPPNSAWETLANIVCH